MITVLLILHLFVTLAMIGVVLLQRSEGGGLGIGSSQGMGSFMTGRGTANLLTRATAVLGRHLLRAVAHAGLPRRAERTSRDPSSTRPASTSPAAPSAPATPPPPAVPTN